MFQLLSTIITDYAKLDIDPKTSYLIGSEGQKEINRSHLRFTHSPWIVNLIIL